MHRRTFLTHAAASASVLGLAGCGFHLRQAPNFVFKTIYLNVAANSGFGIELRRNLEAGGKVRVIRDPAQKATADVIFNVLKDQRERVVISSNSNGQVTEFELRVRVQFEVRTPDDQEVLAPTELVLQQDQSYDETLALAKEAEAQLIYKSLQSDLVQQIMRRLAAIKTL